MSTRTTTKLIGLAAAMLVFLAFAPAASAERIGPHPASGHSVVAVSAPQSVHKPIGPYPAGAHSVPVYAPQFSPDRAEHFGITAGPQPVQVTTLASSDSSGFDWADATIGAATAIGLGLLAAAGVALTRNRRGGIAVS
jgi:hypothetical protein